MQGQRNLFTAPARQQFSPDTHDSTLHFPRCRSIHTILRLDLLTPTRWPISTWDSISMHYIIYTVHRDFLVEGSYTNGGAKTRIKFPFPRHKVLRELRAFQSLLTIATHGMGDGDQPSRWPLKQGIIVRCHMDSCSRLWNALSRIYVLEIRVLYARGCDTK